MSATSFRPLPDYRPQHDEGCTALRCNSCLNAKNWWSHSADRLHWGGSHHAFEPGACTCGLEESLKEVLALMSSLEALRGERDALAQEAARLSADNKAAHEHLIKASQARPRAHVVSHVPIVESMTLMARIFDEIGTAHVIISQAGVSGDRIHDRVRLLVAKFQKAVGDARLYFTEMARCPNCGSCPKNAQAWLDDHRELRGDKD